jgi:hypothetical protein
MSATISIKTASSPAGSSANPQPANPAIKVYSRGLVVTDLGERMVYDVRANVTHVGGEQTAPGGEYQLAWFWSYELTSKPWNRVKAPLLTPPYTLTDAIVDGSDVPRSNTVESRSGRWQTPTDPAAGERRRTYLAAEVIKKGAGTTTAGNWYTEGLAKEAQPGCGVNAITIVGA